jgi:hypothetical protein
MNLNQTTFDALKAIAANKGNRFAALKHYESETKTDGTGGKIADYSILIGFSYHNATVRDLETLKAMKFAAGSIEETAHAELIASCEKTLAAHATGTVNENYNCKDVYEPVEIDGVPINGVRYCTTTGNFNLSGLVQSEKIIKSGVYKEVKSAPKTIAKRKIESLLTKSKVRTFTIHESKLAAAKLNGATIEM